MEVFRELKEEKTEGVTTKESDLVHVQIGPKTVSKDRSETGVTENVYDNGDGPFKTRQKTTETRVLIVLEGTGDLIQSMYVENYCKS